MKTRTSGRVAWPVTLRACVAVVAAALSSIAIAQREQDLWELRACAPPQSLPFSDMDQPGFENRVVEVLAEEMGAYVTYEWVDFTQDLYNLFFAEGLCDVILGIPDGFST
jgi:mxaJ protein